jgi:hypothetical protein
MVANITTFSCYVFCYVLLHIQVQAHPGLAAKRRKVKRQMGKLRGQMMVTIQIPQQRQVHLSMTRLAMCRAAYSSQCSSCR